MKQHHDDRKIAMILPLQLLMDLQDEIRQPMFIYHPFFSLFREIYPRLTRRLCHHALQMLSPAPGELIFAMQESSHRMYFVMSGDLIYTIFQRDATGQVDKIAEKLMERGQHLSEPALWMHWQHKGDLVVPRFASLLALSSQNFAQLIESHPPAHSSCVLYARRFISGMARWVFNKTSDIIDVLTMIPEDKEGGDAVDKLFGNA